MSQGLDNLEQIVVLMMENRSFDSGQEFTCQVPQVSFSTSSF
jgi:hypothetical protein